MFADIGGNGLTFAAVAPVDSADLNGMKK